jgi:hypothetical protein
MTEELDFWSATIAAYAPLQLPAPEMTQKLLKRPPFRFIHDIVAAIDGRFAAYNHVIPAGLQDSANVDTKEKKVEYLTILIEYVNKLMNVKLDVNPKKIVSGHEPEKTNVFLQHLAAAVGYAQQDRAQKEATKQTSAEQPPTKEGEGKKVALTATTMTSSMELPSRDSLPRRKSDATGVASRRQSQASALEKANRFNRRLDGFSLNLSSKAPCDIKEDGRSIVKMWNEVSNPQAETKPSQMPAEALETAINRQLETIKMMDALLKESDEVIDELEALVS